jgi:hypothetical protein
MVGMEMERLMLVVTAGGGGMLSMQVVSAQKPRVLTIIDERCMFSSMWEVAPRSRSSFGSTRKLKRPPAKSERP